MLYQTFCYDNSSTTASLTQPSSSSPSKQNSNNSHELETFKYVFGSSCQSDYFGNRHDSSVVHSMESGIPWEEARYLLEKKYHIINMKQKGQGGFLKGYLWLPGMKNWRTEATLIPKDHIMKPSDCVILVKQPLPKGQCWYVPSKYISEVKQMEEEARDPTERARENAIINLLKHNQQKKLQFTNDMSEEEKMKRIVECSAPITLPTFSLPSKGQKRFQNYQHPSDNESTTTTTTTTSKFTPSSFVSRSRGSLRSNNHASHPSPHPPPGYVCHRCGEVGHWKQLCPALYNPNFQPIKRPKRAAGIPVVMLKEAVTEEEKQNAMVSDEGKLVYMKGYDDNILSNSSASSSTSSSTSSSSSSSLHTQDEDDFYYVDDERIQ